MASKKSGLGKENLRIMEKALSKRKKELERTIKKLEDERDRLRKEIKELKEKIKERSSKLKLRSPDVVGLGEEFVKRAKGIGEVIEESEQEGLGKLSEDLKAMTRIKRKMENYLKLIPPLREEVEEVIRCQEDLKAIEKEISRVSDRKKGIEETLNSLSDILDSIAKTRLAYRLIDRGVPVLDAGKLSEGDKKAIKKAIGSDVEFVEVPNPRNQEDDKKTAEPGEEVNKR